MLTDQQFKDIKVRHSELELKLQDNLVLKDRHQLENVSREYNELTTVINNFSELKKIEKELIELTNQVKDESDSTLKQLMAEEIATAQQKISDLKQSLEEYIRPKDPLDAKNIIVEIRAGAGGDEAALFAAELFRLYSRYAERQGWKSGLISANRSELGGYKEIVLELQGNGAFSKMQYEGGVHRVQRIPKTEKQGRVHTSTASVAVLPKPQEAQIKMNPVDIRVEVCKATGPGGQNVNKRMTAVRVIHLPTGLTVECHTERNLQQNKESAIGLLAAKILEKQEMEQLGALDEKRRAQIGWAKRAEKVRTYNFPQDRLTDHRVKKSFHNLEGIMDGKLDKLVETLNQSL